MDRSKCRVCGGSFDKKDFAKNSKCAGGVASICLACARQRQREYRARNPEKIRERNKEYRRKNHGKKADLQRAYYKRFPERHRAKKATELALIHGEIVRADKCSSCGVSCKPHAHHEDYDKPLDVVWLCQRCHRRLHGKPVIVVERGEG